MVRASFTPMFLSVFPRHNVFQCMVIATALKRCVLQCWDLVQSVFCHEYIDWYLYSTS